MALERVSTTFNMDFSIADAFGINAIKDTYKRAFKGWKDDVRYVAELVIVLNLKCWEHFYKGNEEISKLYADYYHELNDYAYEHFKGDEIDFYFRVTD